MGQIVLTAFSKAVNTQEFLLGCEIYARFAISLSRVLLKNLQTF